MAVIGYFASEYPSISHTFIRREIAALRRRGLEIRTFSIRRAPEAAPLGAKDRREEGETRYLLPAGLVSIASAHVRELVRNPLRYAQAFFVALRNRPPGARALLWSLFYFAEGALHADALHREDVRHLHVHFARAAGDVARVACLLRGIPWSLMLHSFGDYEYPAVLTLPDKIGAASFTACASHFVRAQAMRATPVAFWERFEIVRCGVELRAATPRASRTDHVRIVCVGRLHQEKGHYGLIHAMADLVAAKAPAFHLTLVGDGSIRTDLEARARELGVGDVVEFLGARSEEDVATILADSEVLVLASLLEGLPVVLMEAMSFGLPVVAPNVAGIPELVGHEREGLLFRASDWADLSAQLRRVVTDAELRARLGAAGRTRVSGEFAIDRAVEPLWKRFSSDGAA